ncbi:DUF3253 domain-containing protein [Litorihabitans aurantiacus]|uniref:DUF3253 domain-containing protein n=1 Tax=Litorihabitans aurantiacus TaxID=1930061 RepID=A0AA37XDZ7_9MICO|nr:DUF3253 domain-containing protein [Litorihabitans aurantiacus]GMA31396.1 hypothetical protein GCM10025875_13880 [Litorihabitans aurantiacus]
MSEDGVVDDDGAGDDAAGRRATPTPDGHHVVIDGRRWRATDPHVPDDLAAELRRALMSARRDIGAARRAGQDPTPIRPRVQAAKVALGERGREWWVPVADDGEHVPRIEAAIRTLADARAPRTTCPSDVARVVDGERWRSLMPLVREVAERLVCDGEIVVTQKGEPVDTPWRGPIRIGRPT